MPFSLYLWEQISYNVGMKEKEIKIRADENFIEKVDYLQRINDYKNRSDCVRKVVEKEFRKEKEDEADETRCPYRHGHLCDADSNVGYCNRRWWQNCDIAVAHKINIKEKEDGR